jgi:hypothetical protein
MHQRQKTTELETINESLLVQIIHEGELIQRIGGKSIGSPALHHFIANFQIEQESNKGNNNNIMMEQENYICVCARSQDHYKLKPKYAKWPMSF